MATIDLDAKRRARLEAKGEGPTVILGGKKFEVAPELPYEALEVLGEGNEPDSPAAQIAFIRALLGKDYERFRKLTPSAEDVGELVSGLLREYGIVSDNGAGEEPAEGNPPSS
jgi:hypothetical protein